MTSGITIVSNFKVLSLLYFFPFKDGVWKTLVSVQDLHSVEFCIHSVYVDF